MSAEIPAPTALPNAEAPAMKRSKKVKKLTKKDIDEVLMHDIVELRGHNHWDWDPKTPPPFQNFEELEVTIGSLAQSGEGLALLHDRGEGWVLVVPFVVPGEKVKARVYRHNWYVDSGAVSVCGHDLEYGDTMRTAYAYFMLFFFCYPRGYSHADLVEVIQPADNRIAKDDILCKYFGACAGCQLQHISYADQMKFKRQVVENAFKNYAGKCSQQLLPIRYPPTLALKRTGANIASCCRF